MRQRDSSVPYEDYWVEPPPVCSVRVCARATTDLHVGPDAFGTEGLRTDRWSPARVRQFLAGRRCAARALADAGASVLEVAVGPHREPVWPHGYVGSITHTASFAFAAAGRRGEVSSIGIDSEVVLDHGSLAAVASLTFRPSELARVAGRRDLATAVFSAKESLFKCLYPIVGFFFDYRDAEVQSLDVGVTGVCALSLARDLGAGFPPGRVFPVRVAITGDHVHTCLEIPS
jgi:enterobactin synthetase component D